MMMGANAARCESRCESRTRETASGFWVRVLAALRAGAARALLMRRTALQRKELAGLNEMQLRDLGITSEARRAELRRPFWDI